DGERRQARVGMIVWQRADGRKPAGNRISDLMRVTARPDSGAVDASAAAAHEHAVDDDVQVLLPVIHLVVAKYDLRKPRTVRLHARIAAVPLDSRSAAENE